MALLLNLLDQLVQGEQSADRRLLPSALYPIATAYAEAGNWLTERYGRPMWG